MTTDQIKQCERESEQAEKRDASNPCYGIERDNQKSIAGELREGLRITKRILSIEEGQRASLEVERDHARKQVGILNQAYWGVTPEHKEALARIASLEEALREAIDAFERYEGSVDMDAPPSHRDMMHRLRAALSSTTPPQTGSPSIPTPSVEAEANRESGGIYVASKVKHAAMWQRFRAAGAPINSTWIDEAGEGASASLTDLAIRCIDEAKSARALVLYCEPGEVLKGALFEAGAALAAGVPVFCVGWCASLSKTFGVHPLWSERPTIQDAMDAARRVASLPTPPTPKEDALTTKGLPEECECCGAVATKKDVEGVPLCDGCYEDLKRETNAILSPDLVGGGSEGEQEPQ